MNKPDETQHVHDFKQIEGQSSLECECGAVPDYAEPPHQPAGPEDSLLERLRRELSFYFGAYHGQLQHSRDAVACQENDCVRLRNLLYEPEVHADLTHADAICKWAEDSDGILQTSCGNAFCLDSGTPAENGMKFCCYCGKTLEGSL